MPEGQERTMQIDSSRQNLLVAQAPYGYMKSPEEKRKMVPNPDTAPVVRRY